MGRTAQDLINVMREWIGYSEENGRYREIIDIYNSHEPLARGYRMKYTDEWCDATVSAAAIRAGMTDLIGTECGCEQHIRIFKEKGIWIEDGSIHPEPGYIILFNWNQYGQPNDGYADHIGVVESVQNGIITAIEGNKSNAVGRRNLYIGWGFIRGYAAPRYEKEKDLDTIAREVIDGKYGNGIARKNALEALGVDYDTVQQRVNELVRASKDTDQLAREVIAGKWGYGADRREKLTKAGYNYDAVQRRVNEILSRR